MTKRKPSRRRPETADRPHRPRRPQRGPPGAQTGRQRAAPAGHWLYGAHAVLEALGNPRRRAKRLLISPEAKQKHAASLERLRAARPDLPRAEDLGRGDLGAMLPRGAVHQGLALLSEPLEQPDLGELVSRSPGAGAEAGRASVVIALDQVTDPRNVGAILRSAAAFGALAVIAPGFNASPETGALVKAASGAFEHVPYIQGPNLARALDRLKQDGFWTLGLAAEARETLAAIPPARRLVLVLGAEGQGLRRLTREACDQMVRLPTSGPIGHLNVSNAAAVALYELLGRAGG